MNKALATFALGPQTAFQAVAMPSLSRYAALHGYTLFAPSADWLFRQVGTPAFPEDAEGPRPLSWYKLPLLHHLFSGGFDEAIWVDADVVITDPTKDMSEEVRSDCWQALVYHEVDVGVVPNCGVWWLKADMCPILSEAWSMRQYIQHGWWEQAAIIELMGGNPCGGQIQTGGTELASHTHQLDYEWNPHVSDRRGFSANARFSHATMFPDRLATMKQWAAEAELRSRV